MEFYERAVANGAMSKAANGLRLAREAMAAVRADDAISSSRQQLFERLFHGEGENISAEVDHRATSGAHSYETVLGVLDSIELLVSHPALERGDRQAFYQHFSAPRTVLLDARARFEEVGL